MSSPHSLPLVLQTLLRVPEKVSLEAGSLVWRQGQEQLVSCSETLSTFAMLAGSYGGKRWRRRVLDFAQLYGPLRAWEPRCTSEGSESWTESLEDWAAWARRVQVASKLAGKLAEGEHPSTAEVGTLFPPPGRWELSLTAVRTEKDVSRVPQLQATGRVSRAEYEEWLKRQVYWVDGEAVPATGDSRGRARDYVRGCVRGLLSLAEAELELIWNDESDGLRLFLVGRSFPAVVAGQLICAAHGGKIAVCHTCGAVITSGRKRPAGQRAFCDRECRRVSNRRRKRRERARKRKSDDLS